jgi:outer membrane receptor protein involved in Fe transport
MSSKTNAFRLGLSLLCLLCFIFGEAQPLPGHAQTLRGVVLDAKTGEPMSGATVILHPAANASSLLKQFVRLDGYFTFRNLQAGDYVLEISFTNYKTSTQPVTLSGSPTAAPELHIILQPSFVELSAVTISGGGESDHTTRSLEKHANQLVNIVSARSMQLLPDITVANVLQRVSGVTIERNNSGEGRYPIIRGMDKRYINTLVNGIKIPSPDDKNRFIPLDLFPSEILERLEVSKSLTPSMEGDAIGGTINLVMKDAPSSRLLQMNASAGYNNIFNKQDYLKFDNGTISKSSPAEIHGSSYHAVPADFPVNSLNYTKKGTPINEAFGLTAGNRFGARKQLGILFSGSYQNIFSGTQSTFLLPNAQPALNNIPQFVDLYSRSYSTDNQRLGLTGKIDYRFGNNSKIALTNTFVRLNMFQVRQSFDTIALNSLVDESYRTTWQYQSINSTSLQGTHQLSPTWTLDWTGAFSIASNHIPDQASYSHEYPVLVDPATKATTRGTPDILQSMTRNWEHNTDKDWTGYVNATKQTRLFQRPIEVRIGGMARNKQRDNFYNAYTLGPLLPAGQSTQVFTDINSAQFTFKAGNDQPALNGLNYTFTENVYAGYAQGKWRLLDKLELLGGLRVEHTWQKYTTQLTPDVPGRLGKIWYTDWLPSGQVKYDISALQSIRLSYYRALARPQFAELIPDGPDNYETFKQVGNPYVKHSISDNLDLRYELFPGKADQILLGVFYKNIQDPIEYTAYKSGVTAQQLRPQNIGNATNYGFEAVFTKFFGAFGISANYTYTQSRVTNDSMLYTYRNDQGIQSSKYVSETRPLQGQSNHFGNLSLIYKSPKLGLDLQVAFTYTGERIALVSPYAGLHYWQQPYAGLDASFEKRIGRKFSFYGKLTNLTNTPTTSSLHVPYNTYIAASGSRPLSLQTDPAHQTIVQKDFVRSSLLFGFRYKL